jgi:uncharacterized membrane protein
MDPKKFTFDEEDVEQNKKMAGLAYILFFLPLMCCLDSAYGRFHANQSLVLLLVSMTGDIVLSFIPLIGEILLSFFRLLMFVFCVLGLLNGFNGRGETLPIIGQIYIIK